MNPIALLFDEPTSALDPESTMEVLQVMKALSADGMTMVIVTHEVRFAMDVADTIVMVDDGIIEESGITQERAGRSEAPTHPQLPQGAPAVHRPTEPSEQAASLVGSPDA